VRPEEWTRPPVRTRPHNTLSRLLETALCRFDIQRVAPIFPLSTVGYRTIWRRCPPTGFSIPEAETSVPTNMEAPALALSKPSLMDSIMIKKGITMLSPQPVDQPRPYLQHLKPSG